MIYVVIPGAEQIREIQRQESHYYWSALAEQVLRAQGVLTVETFSGADLPHEAAAIVFARGADPALLRTLPDGAPAYVEGPLSPAQLAHFGVTGRQVSGKLVRIRAERGWLGYLQYPEETYFSATGSEIRLIGPENPWGHTLGVTFFDEPPPDWQVLTRGLMDDQAGDEARPIAIQRGNTILCGVPIFNIGVRHAAVAPFPGRFNTRRHANHEPIFQYWVAQVLSLRSTERTLPTVRIRKWPSGYDCGFSVRFDYDRAIGRQSLESLLADLSARSLKCSIGFLSYLAPENVMRAFEDAGHEIQLHAHADTPAKVDAGFREVRRGARSRVDGVTIHGGDTSVGFLGDTHFDWVLEAGARYIEIFGDGGRPAVPICRIGEDGIPYRSKLAAISRHTSLDMGTAPEAHRLGTLLTMIPERLSRGDYVILMNHPDIHRAEFLQACDVVQRDAVWHITEGECVDWFIRTHFQSRVKFGTDRLKFVMPEDLPPGIEAELTIHWPNDPDPKVVNVNAATTVIDRNGSVKSIRSEAAKKRARVEGAAARIHPLRPTGQPDANVAAGIKAAVLDRGGKSGLDSELAALVEAGSILVLWTGWNDSHEGAHCAELNGKWLDWFKNNLGGAIDIPYANVMPGAVDTSPGRVSRSGKWLARLLGRGTKPSGESKSGSHFVAMARLPLAMLSVPQSVDAYLAGIGNKSRNMLRKASRLGYSAKPFLSRDHLDDIHAINISKETRGGLKMTSSYLEFPRPFDAGPSQQCRSHNILNVGCFKDDKLVAYCNLVCLGDLGIVNRILGHGDHLSDGVMNLLVLGIVEHLIASNSRVRALNYLTLRSRTKEMDAFKRHVGFRPTAIVLVNDDPSVLERGHDNAHSPADAANRHRPAITTDTSPGPEKSQDNGKAIFTFPPYNPKYFSKTGINGLVPAVSDHRGSGFRAALKALNLPRRLSAVDVGAGGFTGATTTVHILDMFDAKIDAVELDADRAERLRSHFGSSINVVREDFTNLVRPEGTYDLAVFDLDSGGISVIFNDFLDKVRPMLKPRGKVISLIVYDCDRAYSDAPRLLNPIGADSQRKFMLDYFGADRLELESVRRAVWPKGYAVLGLVDKWMGHGADLAIGWMVLEKLDPA